MRALVPLCMCGFVFEQTARCCKCCGRHSGRFLCRAPEGGAQVKRGCPPRDYAVFSNGSMEMIFLRSYRSLSVCSFSTVVPPIYAFFRDGDHFFISCVPYYTTPRRRLRHDGGPQNISSPARCELAAPVAPFPMGLILLRVPRASPERPKLVWARKPYLATNLAARRPPAPSL